METRANFGTRVSQRPRSKIVDIVWEQPEIDKLLVKTLDGTKDEWCWSRAKFRANAALASSTTVCPADAAESEVFLHSYISELTGLYLVST